jgi:hypothetical protein
MWSRRDRRRRGSSTAGSPGRWGWKSTSSLDRCSCGMSVSLRPGVAQSNRYQRSEATRPLAAFLVWPFPAYQMREQLGIRAAVSSTTSQVKNRSRSAQITQINKIGSRIRGRTVRESNRNAVVDHYERNEERRWVAELFERGPSGGTVAVGLEGALLVGRLGRRHPTLAG